MGHCWDMPGWPFPGTPRLALAFTCLTLSLCEPGPVLEAHTTAALPPLSLQWECWPWVPMAALSGPQGLWVGAVSSSVDWGSSCAQAVVKALGETEPQQQ